MRWQVPHPRSSEFFWSTSEGINPSSPLFSFLCILRFAIPLSTAAPTRLGKFHTAAAERGGEGERERVQVGLKREGMRTLRKSSVIVLRSPGRREWEALVFTCK